MNKKYNLLQIKTKEICLFVARSVINSKWIVSILCALGDFVSFLISDSILQVRKIRTRTTKQQLSNNYTKNLTLWKTLNSLVQNFCKANGKQTIYNHDLLWIRKQINSKTIYEDKTRNNKFDWWCPWVRR